MDGIRAFPVQLIRSLSQRRAIAGTEGRPNDPIRKHMSRACQRVEYGARMTEREVIIETVNRLFIATDIRAWQDVRSVFAPTVLFDMTSLTGGAPAHRSPVEIADTWRTGLAGVDKVHHQSGNYLVDVQGDQATVFCYAVAYHKTAGDVRMFVGSYDVNLVRTDRWRIDAFKYNVTFVEPPL